MIAVRTQKIGSPNLPYEVATEFQPSQDNETESGF